MAKVNLLFNGIEYFGVKSTSISHSLNKCIAVKSATFSCVAGRNFSDFLTELNNKKILLGSFYLNDKLYLEGFINDSMIYYKDNPDGGTDVDVRLLDRFVGLVASDLIYSRPRGSLQGFMSDVLIELGYLENFAINSYQKQVKSPFDLIKAGANVDLSKNLKSFARSSLVEESSADLIGELFATNKIILISNGYDTLTIEKPNLKQDATFYAFRDGDDSNISSAEKYGEMPDASSLPPSAVITLNSYSKEAKKDSNTSVISFNPNGIPHVIRLNRVSMQASYQDISGLMNFSFAGIRARSNSYILRLPNTLLDKNNDFFSPNRTINYYDSKYLINSDMIIMDVRMDIDAEGGEETTLNISHEEIFEDNSSIKNKGRLLI